MGNDPSILNMPFLEVESTLLGIYRTYVDPT